MLICRTPIYTVKFESESESKNEIKAVMPSWGLLKRGRPFIVGPLVDRSFRMPNRSIAAPVRNWKAALKRSQPYMTVHLPSSLSFRTLKATRAASVKASLTPRFRMAEHSRYRSAPMRRATSRPWS